MVFLGIVFLVLAAVIAAVNFFLSFVRYPLCRFFGWKYPHISGLPAVGTLSLALANLLLPSSTLLLRGTLILAVADTGGIPWFVAVVAWHLLSRRS